MTLAFLISILVTGVSQAIKLIARMFGVSKQIATKITFFVIFALAILFTIGQQFAWFSMDQVKFLFAIITGAIGSYELFLNKTGLDGLFKDMMEIERGEK